MYECYYKEQAGSGLPIFVGARGQRGHGLGSFVSGLFRSAVPMIKKGLATFGKHALQTGLEIANDAVDGGNLKSSAKRRIPQGIKRLAQSAVHQSDAPPMKKFKSNRKTKKRRDIFD